MRPIKITGKKVNVRKQDEGPKGWFLPTVESSYTRLATSDAVAAPSELEKQVPKAAFASSLQQGKGESVLAQVVQTIWRDLFAEYKRRKVRSVMPVARAVAAPPAPVVPGGKNWLPLGPTVVLDGQTVGDQPVGGRVSGLAISSDGQIVYAASANGGVFRSDDGGTAWRSLMDGFDVDPTNFASASLVCGAIAIDPADPNRVYVGTGEGDTDYMFRKRVVNALPAYRGIGPIRTDDGGTTWVTELTAPGSLDLAGQAFFALAVDPRNRENVLGATTAGLYQRVPKTGGAFEWIVRRPGVHSSVVVASASGTTRFFTAEWGKGVFQSSDGKTWTQLGKGFPTNSVGRSAIGVQANNPNLVYAFVATTKSTVHGVYRLDDISGGWNQIGNLPDVLPVNKQGKSQGDYDLAIAVDPADANLIYIGGSYYDDRNYYPASIWRCHVQGSGAGYKINSSASIGTHAHADVHILLHTPGDSNELWCGCDGGVFLNRDPRGTGQFASQNTGLACLCTNFIAQHPTDPNIIFTGLQDNGTAQTAGGPAWSHVKGGDGGYCLINWANPNLVLVFANGTVHRSTIGGTTHGSWSTAWDFPWATMTQPIVSPSFNPTKPTDADFVAVGAGEQVFVSKDFAASWLEGWSFALPRGSGSVFALAFASTTRLYVGTTAGQVFRADRSGNNWSLNRLDDVAAGPLGLPGLISDIAIDWMDATLASVYVAFGGMGDRRRVWRFNGTKWEIRSGLDGENKLLDVEHNAIVVDESAPNNVYVGADIGVWHSSDRGLNWMPLQNGLPDAPVFDLQIHPTQRLLRAATHGRGIYEITLD